jgi:hypothetical protein
VTGTDRDLVAEARRQWRAHGWQGPDLGMAAVLSLMRAQQIVLGRLEDAVRPYGLSYARYEVLVQESTAALNAGPFSDVGLPAEAAEQLIDVLAQLRRAAGDF